MFNYYCRVASLAREMEIDGRREKAEWLRQILKSENRCIFCGCTLGKKENRKGKDRVCCLCCSAINKKTSVE